MSALSSAFRPDYAAARRHMVQSQISPNQVTDPRILAAMSELPRELFVPSALMDVAYLDEDLEVAPGRYLIEPMVIARLLQAAMPQLSDRVLVAGAASGYDVALLARLAGTVVALDSDGALIAQAQINLQRLGIRAAFEVGPLASGWAAAAPYNLIVAGGAVETVPDTWLAQLADGGRIVTVVPVQGPVAVVGKACLLTKRDGRVMTRELFDANVRWLPGLAPRESFRF